MEEVAIKSEEERKEEMILALIGVVVIVVVVLAIGQNTLNRRSKHDREWAADWFTRMGAWMEVARKQIDGISIDHHYVEMVKTSELVECVDCGCVVMKCHAVKGKDRIEEIFNTAIGISLGIAHKRIVNDWYCKRCHRENTVTESGPIGTESREKAEASIRNDERKKCWQEINEQIGPPRVLKGSGTDRQAERNGLVRAANIIMQKL